MLILERQSSYLNQQLTLTSYLLKVEILSTHLNCVYLPNKSVIWPSVASMSIMLWSSYFLRWVQVSTIVGDLAQCGLYVHPALVLILPVRMNLIFRNF